MNDKWHRVVFPGAMAFGLTSAVLLLAFYFGGMYPFGDGTISWCDMNQQAIPLLCDFKDILAGKTSMLLNLSNAGGMNFYGVFFFFLSSPFSLLVAFIDKADIPLWMNILVILKLSLSGFTAAVTFKKLFGGLGNGLSAILGVSYALCGYGMAFYQNIMWLDMMYLLPLTVLGAYRLINLRRPALLFICLSLGVVFNYYISFMVFLFIILFFGVYSVMFQKTDKGIYLDLAFCGVGSLCVTAVVWVPSFLQYVSSARGSNFIWGLKTANFYSEINTTLPILLCTALIFAAISFSVPSALDRKQPRFLCVLFFLLLVPIFVEPVNMMWHTGDYMSFPARYGYITVFMGLMIAAEQLSVTRFPKKSRWLQGVICIIVAVAAVVGGIVFCLNNVSELSHYVQTLWGSAQSLSGLVILCSIAFTGYFVLMCFIKCESISRRMAAMLLCLIVVCEGFCACNVYMLSAKGKLNLYNYRSFIALESKAAKTDFYRVNTVGKLTDANMTGAAGFNSISHYTSLNNRDFMQSAKQLGYSGYWMETGNWDGSILSDALLSVGYTVSPEDGRYNLRENPYYMGLGIKSDKEVPEQLSDTDRLLSVGDAFSAITGCENSVTQYSPYKMQNCSYYNIGGIHTLTGTDNRLGGVVQYKIEVTSRQTLYFDCYNGFSNRLVEPINDSFAVSVNGSEISAAYPSQRQNGLLRLGSFENETVDITLHLLRDVECSSFGVFAVDEEIAKNAANKAQSLNLKADAKGVSGFVSQKGKYFISIAYNDGYRMTLNGKPISFEKALGGFVSVDVPAAGELQITLLPKGFIPAVAISLLSVAVAIICAIFKNKIQLLTEPLQNITLGVFLGVVAIVVLSVYIIPIILNLTYPA